MTIPWLVLDVVLGLLLAGLVAPFALAALPEQVRGPGVLALAAVTCIVVVSIFRRFVVRTPGVDEKH